MAKSVSAFGTWIAGQSGVSVTSNTAYLVNFTVDHTAGITHKVLMDEMIKHDMWLISEDKKNNQLKHYIVAPFHMKSHVDFAHTESEAESEASWRESIAEL